MENTDDFIFFKDRNHVFTCASRNIMKPFGPDRESVSVLGLTDYDVFPEKSADISYRLEKQVFAEVPVASELHESLTLDGTLAWLDNHKYPIRNDKGEIVGLFGVARDVTEHMKAQEALRENEDSLKESQRIAGLGSYVTDIAAGVWTSSTILDQLFGIDEGYNRSVEGWGALVHPDDREGMVTYFVDEVIGKGRPFDREYRIVRPSDGAGRWVHGRGRLEVDAEGRPVKMVGTIQDITERKQADAALRESQAMLQLFIMNAPVALAMFDREMRYMAVSHRWAKDHAVNDREIIGRSHYEINTDVPERWKETHRRGLAGERQRSEEDRYDRADGSMQWIRWEILPWQAADGSIMFYEDVTER
jgi:PAS domain S-box-containing protein